MKATRKSRFSLGMKIACILSCLTLFTMGFASWWIVKMPEDKTQTGSFEVYAVTNKNIDITLANDEAPTIIFGKPATGKSTWLVAGSDIKEQSLSATIAFDVTVKDGTVLSNETTIAQMLSNVSIELSVPDATAMKTAIDKNYLKTPTLTYQVGSETAQSVAYDATTGKFTSDISMANVNDSEVTVTLTLTFEWGSAFGGTNINPYTYFNGLKYSQSTNVTGTAQEANVAAKAVLEAIEALKGSDGFYTLSIKANAKS